jgi:hypothetical protein
MLATLGNMTMDHCTVTNNWAHLLAGGIYGGATSTLNDVTITGNSAADGGGFYVSSSGLMDMTDCTVNSNTSESGLSDAGHVEEEAQFTFEGGSLSGSLQMD